MKQERKEGAQDLKTLDFLLNVLLNVAQDMKAGVFDV